MIRSGLADLEAAWRELPRGPWRWGAAVARAEGCYLGRDAATLLVAGVVVEYGRPLHPVVLVSRGADTTSVHLWPALPVERTEGVKRFLAQVARALDSFGAGPVVTTNIADLL
ncbi:MAG TPA: hypothetical protein VMT19_00655 [Thermoanaerobaculaceae bacterium]|nr:hypothetical protein [Thermoanaerobaculaceae bacterium]